MFSYCIQSMAVVVSPPWLLCEEVVSEIFRVFYLLVDTRTFRSDYCLLAEFDKVCQVNTLNGERPTKLAGPDSLIAANHPCSSNPRYCDRGECVRLDPENWICECKLGYEADDPNKDVCHGETSSVQISQWFFFPFACDCSFDATLFG